MFAVLPEELTLDFSSVQDYNYLPFDATEAVVATAIRQKDNRLYEAVRDIDSLATYIWDDVDYEQSLIDTPLSPVQNQYAIDCHNNFTRIEQDVNSEVNITVYDGTTAPATVVYRKSNKHYYKSKRDNIVVNFITDTGLATNWDDLTTNPPATWRYTEILPEARSTTLNWKDIGATNRYKMFDKSLNKSTVDKRAISGTTISFAAATNTIANTTAMENIFVGDKFKIVGSTSNDAEYTVATVATNRLSFTVEEVGTITDEAAGESITISIYITIRFQAIGMDKIAIFNPFCSTIELSIVGTPFIETRDMFDDVLIVDFETFVFDDFLPVKKTIFTIPRDITTQVQIIFKDGEQNIGEVLAGKSIYMGKALDSTSIDTISYGEVVESDNGEVYFDELDSQNKLVDKVNFTISVPSNQLNTYLSRKNTLINRRLIVAGTDDDNPLFAYLVLYGFGKDSTSRPITNNSKSTYDFNIRTFI